MRLMMNKIGLLNNLTKLTRRVVDLRLRQQSRYTYRKVCGQIHIKQAKQTEKQIEESLQPFFDKQIKAVRSKIRKSESEIIPPAELVFNPRDWDQELLQALVKPLSKAIANAYAAQLTVMDAEAEKVFRINQTKMIDPEYQLETPHGMVDIGILTEYPDNLKQTIRENLEESFAQPYWSRVNDTTLGDIDKILSDGLTEGWSMNGLVNEISGQLLEEGRYARRRARLIAQTEAGHSLNGARTQAIKDLADTLPDEAKPRRTWFSALKDTTRAEHANLDGVPEDSEGLWTLADVRVRWPGDVNLPVNMRANCFCSVLAEFGIGQTEANQLIQEYEQREEEWRTEQTVSDPTKPLEIFGSSQAKIQHIDYTEEEVIETVQSVLGKNATLQDVASLAGAPDNATVDISPIGAFQEISVFVNGPGYRMQRTIRKDISTGEIIISNKWFAIDKSYQGQGIGTKAFARQVEQATKNGVSKIRTTAAGDKSDSNLNGYYTWPRLGYDAPIPKVQMEKLPATLKGSETISDLMLTEEGRDWWLNNGATTSMEFDLQNNSTSQRALDYYLRNKGLK